MLVEHNNLLATSMAFGTRCTSCGWQEIDHYSEGEMAEGDPSEIKPGYSVTLDTCVEFDSDCIGFEYIEAEELLGEIHDESDIEALRCCSAIKSSPFISCLIARLKKYHIEHTTSPAQQ